MTPDPYDLAITLSQRLADLLSPVEMARIRVLSREDGVSSLTATAIDIALATNSEGHWCLLYDVLPWCLERYGAGEPGWWLRRGPTYHLCREAVHIARSHGYVVEAIMDSQEGVA